MPLLKHGVRDLVFQSVSVALRQVPRGDTPLSYPMPTIATDRPSKQRRVCIMVLGASRICALLQKERGTGASSGIRQSGARASGSPNLNNPNSYRKGGKPLRASATCSLPDAVKTLGDSIAVQLAIVCSPWSTLRAPIRVPFVPSCWWVCLGLADGLLEGSGLARGMPNSWHSAKTSHRPPRYAIRNSTTSSTRNVLGQVYRTNGWLLVEPVAVW